MNDRITLWLPAIFLLPLALLTFWLDQTVQPPGAKRDGSGRHDPDYTVENFTATRMGANGLPRYVMMSRKMEHFPDDDSTHLDTPNFTRYAQGRPPLHIEAKKGLISADGEHAYFSEQVKVTREPARDRSEMSISSPYLHIIPNQDLVLTDREVILQDAHTRITATGMELNSKTRIIKLLSGVKGHHEKKSRK